MNRVTRRGFLKTTAVAAGGFAVPHILPSSVWAAETPPSEKIRVGVIGCGIMGDRLRKIFHSLAGSTVTAVCDVNPDVRNRVSTQMPGVKTYADFRELLAQPDLDAVAIGTVHHMHAIPAIAAAKAGKHIYCEKPLTHTIKESRAVLDAVKKAGVILQVGTHRRAHPTNRLGAELLRNRKLGKIKTIHVGTRPGLTRDARPAAPDPAVPMPEDFAWDLWLGPAPFVPFCDVWQKRKWNQFSDYSTGEITLTDCHIFDWLLWAVGHELKGPIEIEGKNDPQPDVAYRVSFQYANGIPVVVEGTTRQPLSPGVTVEGEAGSLLMDIFRYKLVTTPATLQTAEFGPTDARLPAVKWGANEWWACCEDFIAAVKTRAEPLCPVEGGHAMTVLSDLVWIAPRLGRKLKWDDASEQFVGDDEANGLLHYEYRKPWTL